MKTNKLHIIKNSGFKVPTDYFTSIEDSILSEIKLKEIASKSGYKVPDNYFEALEENILNASQLQKEVKVIKLLSWKKIAYTSAVAASLLLMINLFFNTTHEVTIDNIETASIETYIINEDLEPNEFASLFSKEDLSNIQLINDGYNSQNLENFVIENLEIEDITTN